MKEPTPQQENLYDAQKENGKHLLLTIKEPNCLSCQYLKVSAHFWYCKKLKHEMENGYAMINHSKNCKYYERKI